MNRESARDYGYVVQLEYPPASYTSNALRQLVHELTAAFNFTGVQYSNDKQDDVILSAPIDQSHEIYRAGFSRTSIMLEKGLIQGGSAEVFSRSVEDVVGKAVKALHLQGFAQRVVIRVLVNPKGTNDSREFIGNRICRFERKHLECFNRPIHAVGLRCFFPPGNENEPEYDIKIETLLRDVSTIFIENTASFPKIIAADDVKSVVANIATTRNFIYNQVFTFLEQYNSESGK